MLLNNRHGAVDSDAYRYGFNGKEKDDEVKGDGAQYDYGFRIYDPRLGKFLSQDPLFKSYPWFTPYQYAGNSPIWAIDLDGLESRIVILQKDDWPIVVERQSAFDIEWQHKKAATYKAFANHEGWIRGQSEYQSSTKNWSGPRNGTLTIDATGNTAKIYYDKSGVLEQIVSSLSSSSEAINTWFFNPNHLVEGSEAFQVTFWTYTSSIALEPLVEVAVIGSITYLIRARNGVKAYEALSKAKTTSVIGRAKDIDKVAEAAKVVTNKANKGGFSRLSNDSAWNKIIEKYKNITDDVERWKKVNNEWWETYNKPWLDEIIERGDDILDVSKASKKNLKNVDGTPTHYARERAYLKSQGYVQKGSRWVKK